MKKPMLMVEKAKTFCFMLSSLILYVPQAPGAHSMRWAHAPSYTACVIDAVGSAGLQSQA
jgi:hypothetical protein